MLSVLIIDDDKITHKFIKRALEGVYELYSVFSGEEGLEKIPELKPDLILLDVEMPGKNGYEVCELLKSDTALEHIPVIFLSSHSTLRERMQGFEAGADDFIVKPFQPEDLRAKLQVISRRQGTEKSLSAQVEEAQKAAYAALSGSSDIGQAFYFIERCHNVANYEGLAEEFFKITNNLNLTCTLVIQSDVNEEFYSSKLNQVPPLEADLISLLRHEKRFFDFGCRTQINYQNISLLIKNMPLDDMHRYGRIKDLFPAMLSAADTKINQIVTFNSIKDQANEINQSFNMVVKALNRVKESINDNQKAGIKIMRDMLIELDRELPRMGLDDDQEQYLINRIDLSIIDAHDTSSILNEITKYFDVIVNDFKKQGEKQQILLEKITNLTTSGINADGDCDEGYDMDVELF